MAVCSSCGKTVKKGEGGFSCNECYAFYCEDCGYQYTDSNGDYVCMSCGGDLTYTYASY